MTEAEILNAPENDYMNGEQLRFFRVRLIQIEADLRKVLQRPVESMREAVSESDPTDVASREEEQANELRSLNHSGRMFDEVRQAIARIDEGLYGYCQDTGDPIGIARLLVKPTAMLTIDAQERRERRGKLGLTLGREAQAHD